MTPPERIQIELGRFQWSQTYVIRYNRVYRHLLYSKIDYKRLLRYHDYELLPDDPTLMLDVLARLMEFK